LLIKQLFLSYVLYRQKRRFYVCKSSFTNKYKCSQQRRTGGAGKAIASAFIPGIGEFLNDRNKEGAFFLGTRIGASIITNKISKSILNDIAKTQQENVAIKLSPLKKYASIVMPFVALGLAIANIVDAYKGKQNKKQ